MDTALLAGSLPGSADLATWVRELKAAGMGQEDAEVFVGSL